MTELKIAIDDYGCLIAITPDGEEYPLLADIPNNPYYGIVKLVDERKANERECEQFLERL